MGTVELASLVVTLIIGSISITYARKSYNTAKESKELDIESFKRNEHSRATDIFDKAKNITDGNQLNALIEEVSKFSDSNRRIALRGIRLNPLIGLPGSVNSGKVIDRVVDQKAFDDYVDSLEYRYSNEGISLYNNLDRFMRSAVRNRVDIDYTKLSDLLTGDTIHVQEPDHRTYQRLLEIVPDLAPELLYKIDGMRESRCAHQKFNLITGVLFFLVDSYIRGCSYVGEKGKRLANQLNDCSPRLNSLKEDSGERSEYDSKLRSNFASLLHRGVLDFTNTDGAKGFVSEPATAMISRLVYVVGYLLAEDEPHLNKRMVENLASVVRNRIKIDEYESWGLDSDIYSLGIQLIKGKCPGLWDLYGAEIEDACAIF